MTLQNKDALITTHRIFRVIRIIAVLSEIENRAYPVGYDIVYMTNICTVAFYLRCNTGSISRRNRWLSAISSNGSQRI